MSVKRRRHSPDFKFRVALAAAKDQAFRKILSKKDEGAANYQSVIQ
jgi:transposase-like protein